MNLGQRNEYRRYCKEYPFLHRSNGPKTAAREDVLLLRSFGVLLSLYNYYTTQLHRCTVPQAHRKRKYMTQTRKTDSRRHIKRLKKYRKKTPQKGLTKNAGGGVQLLYVHFHIRQTCQRTRVQVKCPIGKIRMIDFPPFLDCRKSFLRKHPEQRLEQCPRHILYMLVSQTRDNCFCIIY